MTLTHCTVVTGGGRGIGRAISSRMAREGAVIAVGQNQDHLDSILAEIRAAGGIADCIAGDVSDQQTAKRTVELAAKNGWAIRNLVCNAGIGKSGAAHEFDPVMFQRIFDINVKGTWWFIHEVLPQMIKAKQGTICLMSSTVGVTPYKFDAPYSASKAAVNAIAASVAGEIAQYGLIIVPLCPCYVEGEMTERSISGIAQRRNISREEARQVVASVCPGKRVLPAEELADILADICKSGDMTLSGVPYMFDAPAQESGV